MFEKDADLGRTALEARELLDAFDGFGDRGGGMLTQGRLQGVVIVLQFADGSMKLQVFEGLYASSLILLEVAAHGIFTTPHRRQSADAATLWPSTAALPSCVAHGDADGDNAGNPVP